MHDDGEGRWWNSAGGCNPETLCSESSGYEMSIKNFAPHYIGDWEELPSRGAIWISQG